MASVVNSFAISGIDAYTVKIETDTIYGKPVVSIVGLANKKSLPLRYILFCKYPLSVIFTSNSIKNKNIDKVN
ncbi:hypothetical protein [Haloimpatiens lingqiaonensis]|uniref:hypothetical protein n=1 Tax=Haloimpatiens lingqiaonensis TaxID=1380675 RepID=UPI0037BF9855